MKWTCMVFLILTVVKVSCSANRTLAANGSDMDSMWSQILPLMLQKLGDTSGSCVTLYNFDASLTRKMHAYPDMKSGGFFIAEELGKNMTREQRRRPVCFGFLAIFASKHNALTFAANGKEGISHPFLKATSFAAILVQEVINTFDIGQILDYGSFGRTPQLTILAKVSK